MICFLYDLIFFLFACAALPHFLFRLKQAKDPRLLLRERWGFLSEAWLAQLDGREIVWVHAVSVGEVLGVKRIVEKARERFPQFQFVLSVTTPTGYEVAKKELVDFPIFYTPFDISWATKRVMRILNPRALLLMETEIWPNLITAAKERDIRIGLLNGRLSPSSFKGYFLIRQLLKPLLAEFSFFAVQSETDRDRFVAIGAPAERVFITGSVKFDEVSEDILVDQEKLRKSLGISSDAPVFLAGSTHPGEEEFILDAFKELHSKHPKLFLILAPRHVNRTEQILEVVKKAGLEASRFSQPDTKKPVMVVDVMGRLRELYAIADIVFMGGSLIKHGGQNPVEAIRFSRGVISGPFVFNFQQIYDILKEAKAATIVYSREDLRIAADDLLSDYSKREEMGRAAKQLVLKLQGATEKQLKILETHLSPPRKRGSSGNTLDSRFRAAWLSAGRALGVAVPRGRRGGNDRMYYSLEKFYLRLLKGEAFSFFEKILYEFLKCLSIVYSGSVAAVRELYSRNIFPTKKLSIPVVSVGNLTWGGTGKTPLVDYIADYFESRGQRVFILTRGYGNDEMKELERGHPKAKVVVGKDRYESAKAALAILPADVAVLDDGFQHWKLQRDLDIVVINTLEPFGNEYVIPAGMLREPVSSIRRAGLVMLTHTNLVSEEALRNIKIRLHQYGIDSERIVESVHEPLFLYRASSGERVSLEAFGSKQALAFSGIGHPASFEGTLKKAGLRIERAIRFSDHHAYSADELREIKTKASANEEMITTEKDFLRSPGLMIDTVDPLVLKIHIRVTKREELLHARLDSILRR